MCYYLWEMIHYSSLPAPMAAAAAASFRAAGCTLRNDVCGHYVNNLHYYIKDVKKEILNPRFCTWSTT